MSDQQTMVRTHLTVDDATFLLAQGQDVDELQRRVEEAVRAGGRFESFTVVGNRSVSVLFTPTTRVALSLEIVPFDPRDIGDADVPFGGLFDE